WPGKSFIGTATAAKALDDATVEVQTRQVDVSIPNGTPYLWIVPKKYFEQVGLDGFIAKPMGSGPYEMVDFRAGDQVRFKKKPSHAFRNVQATEILLRAVPAQGQLINGLRTGE